MSQPTAEENRQWIYGLSLVCLVLLYKVFVVEDNKKLTSSGLVDKKESFKSINELTLGQGAFRSDGYGEKRSRFKEGYQPNHPEGYTSKRFKEGYANEAPVFWNVGDLAMVKTDRQKLGSDGLAKDRHKEGFELPKPY